jgi:hypothetical protein
MKRQARTIAIALASGLLAGLGCEPDPLTEIMVVIDTDMAVPSELDGFRVEVRDRSEETRFDQSFDLLEQVTLPADFGVLPRNGDASRRITVEVSALSGIDVLFSTRAITSFVEGRKVYLQMFLARRCIGVECSPSETCRREGCVPAIDPPLLQTLPSFEPSSLGGPGDERPHEVIATKDAVYVAGTYGAAFSHAGNELAPPGEVAGALLVGFSAAGAHRFTRSLPSTLRSYLNRIAVTPNGRIEATGYFGGALTESSTGKTLTAGGSQESYLVRYTTAGTLEALEAIGTGSGNVQSFGFAIGKDGQRLVGGLFSGQAGFGVEPKQTLTSTAADDGFVAALAPDLSGVWAVTLGGVGRDRVNAIATTQDAIYAGGIFETAAQIGPDALAGALENGFVAALTPSGAVQWARAFSGSADDELRDIAALPDGGVVVVGATQSADFMADTLARPGVDGDAYVAALAPSGSVRWAARLTGAGSSQATSVSVGQYQGEPVVVVGGRFSGQLEAGTQTLVADATDLFVAVLSLDGDFRFVQQVGGPGSEGRAEVATHGPRILLAGEFQSGVGLGSASFASAGGSDILLVQIAP